MEINDYGHPHKEVLERLDTCGSEHFCTIDYGAIKIKSNGETIAFDFYKKRIICTVMIVFENFKVSV